MRPSSAITALLLTGIAIATLPSAASAATGAWSPRSSAPAAQLWTRAGLVRVRHAAGEISTAKIVRPRREKPPVASAAIPTGSTRIASFQGPDRGPQSSFRAAAAQSAVARLRTSALPDSAARSATLALLAGVFHEAHAPPFSLRSRLS